MIFLQPVVYSDGLNVIRNCNYTLPAIGNTVHLEAHLSAETYTSCDASRVALLAHSFLAKHGEHL